MKTFEYRHDPGLSQEFVNGGYELGEVRRISIEGHEILYRLGSATLDNSCCGNFGCGFGLVIGEALETTPPKLAQTPTQDQVLISTVREIASDDALAETISKTLMEREALGVVNFYITAQPVVVRA